MKLMEWNRLLSRKRLRRPAGKPVFDNNPFEDDQDRICFSQPFRRLQAKTQVHPLADNDHIRTRLIHSIEVGCIGQALGQLIGKELIRRHKLDATREEFGSLLRAACLAHDIGHPPFGHAGDYAIRDWFRKRLPDKLKSDLSDAQRQDLQHWEGNAQSFRIITQIENYRGKGGLQLTCATLGIGMKYPWAVSSARRGKFGFFQSEQDYAAEVANELGLIPLTGGGWCRHPLAYVVEAADDICYSIADLEDGIVMGSFDYDAYEELLKPFLTIRVDRSAEFEQVARSQAQKISYLRSKVIMELVEECNAEFLKREDDLLAGTYEGSLVKQVPHGDVITAAIQYGRDRIYHHERKQYAEIAAFEIIDGLLQAFVDAYVDIKHNGEEKASFKSQRLCRLMGDMRPEAAMSTYEALMRIADFVSGMTDRYAVGMFKQIKGIALGSLTPVPQSA